MCGLMFLSVSTWAQTRAVTGTIKGNQADSILIGATIAEKGTPNVVESDESGNFSIMVSDTGKVILIVTYSSGGYKAKEIEVGSQSNVTVQMEDDVQQMEEVVIVGYGVVKKSDLTGSVASVKPEELAKVPTANVMESIQGKVAGVDVARTSGSATAKPQITIRGNRSVNAGNGPLYIVDGVQYANVEDINSNDIESMEVLKDASSTAIYGSRGGNGVVILTTKSGKFNKDNNKVRVFFNTYTGTSVVSKFPTALSGTDLLEIKKEAYRSANNLASDQTVTDDQAFTNANEKKGYQTGQTTDYVSKLIKRGSQQNIQAGFSAGTEKLKAYFSADYYQEKGVMKLDELKRYTARLNLDYQINKLLKIGTNTQLTHYEQQKRINPVTSALRISPYGSAYDTTTGALILKPFGLAQMNPLADEQKGAYDNNSQITRIFPLLYTEITPLKGLTIRGNAAFTIGNTVEGTYNSKRSFFASDSKPSNASLGQNGVNNKNFQLVANYMKSLRAHSFTFTALTELLEYKTTTFTASGDNVPADALSFYNLGSSTSNLKITSGYEKNNIVSYAGRVNYAFKNRYLVTATGRFDGASVLADGNKWDFFPSVAAAWKLTEEKFLASQKTFDEIKLRVSYGVAGNSSVAPYSSQSLLGNIPWAWDGTPNYATSTLTSLGNPNLKWEKTYTLDFGLDLAILKNRIQFTGDYYMSNTQNLLLNKVLPASSGYSIMLDNVGETKNNGLELGVTSHNVKKGKFTWSTTLTFMKNQEQVTKLLNNANVMETSPGSGNYLVVGNAVTSYYDYEKVGIWQSNEADAIAAYNVLNPSSKVKAGDIKVKDQNGDGVINSSDKKVVGSNVPKFSMGLSNNFKIGNFDFSFYWFARVGQTVSLLGGNSDFYDRTGVNNSLNIGNTEYWTTANGSNNLPRPAATNDQFRSTLNYMDGSFLKLRSVNIAYNLPTEIAKKYLRCEKVKVYVTGRNLLTFSKIKNYDSELNGNVSNPLVKLYTFGLNAEF